MSTTTTTQTGTMSGQGLDTLGGANGLRPRVVLTPALAGRAGTAFETVVDFDAIAGKYRSVLDALTAQSAERRRVTEVGLFASALDAVSNGEQVPDDLLSSLVDARSLEYDEAVASARFTFERDAAAEYTARVQELQGTLEQVLLDELLAILDAAATSIGVLAEHGVTDAERAIETGLTEQWTTSKALGERWLDAQRTRLWLSVALESGFSTLPSSSPKLERSRRANAGNDCWSEQFEDVLDVAPGDQPAEVLARWVALPAEQRPAPMVEVIG